MFKIQNQGTYGSDFVVGKINAFTS